MTRRHSGVPIVVALLLFLKACAAPQRVGSEAPPRRAPTPVTNTALRVSPTPQGDEHTVAAHPNAPPQQDTLRRLCRNVPEAHGATTPIDIAFEFDDIPLYPSLKETGKCASSCL